MEIIMIYTAVSFAGMAIIYSEDACEQKHL